MTTDPFTEAARAEAEAVMSEARERVGITVQEQTRYVEGHVAGAEWGREQALAQEPTDAEVEAAAEGMWDRYGNRGMWKHAPDRLRLAFRADARAALSAARAARRDEETR